MRRAVVVGALALLLAGCSGHESLPAPVGTIASTGASTLLTRPLKLPAMGAGSVCPVTPVSSRKVDLTNPRGHGPLYLGGPMPQGHFPWNKMTWILADGALGPVLFRGGRIDGTGSLKFSGSPAEHSDPGVTLSSGGGITATFYEHVIDPGSEGAFYVYPATAGCYALQVDGASFDDVIVITAG